MAAVKSEKVVSANGVTIATEAFGDPAAPPVLLIMGAMASMLWWPDAFCRKLAASGRYVIRYDNRDTGLSTKYAPGNPPYSMDDMAGDAVAVLDAYGIPAANVVGMSLGGMIAQILALSAPRRVSSLTLVSTTPIGLGLELPPISAAYMEHAASAESLDWSDRTQVIDFMTRDARIIASSTHPHDVDRIRAFIERDYDRSGGLLSATNHFMLQGGDSVKGKLKSLEAPLLVIHGTTDPIFSVEHGMATADAVAGSEFLPITGGGHELHGDDWGLILAAITRHTE
ncbi:Aclacinomycin methylesterase RdmC [Ensifer sp. M14]|uniref:alpha/beta fold hydrolase n=1 Tax=Ensifer sp. M14 TaxID=2203782 RepID=UPI000E1D8635|nr:alpha/beta hydrolase [Ensifer sp. M14]RDL48770.1 Aclacinomycin methylesterase RdmC [Ensifer sp. M14]